MANNKAMKAQIPFNAPINMNLNDCEIKQFSGWNKKNSPIYSGCLSPFYKKTERVWANSVFNTAGDRFSLESDGSRLVLKKNGDTVAGNSFTRLSTYSRTQTDEESICFWRNGSNYTEIVRNVKTGELHVQAMESGTAFNYSLEKFFNDEWIVDGLYISDVDGGHYCIVAYNLLNGNITFLNYLSSGGAGMILKAEKTLTGTKLDNVKSPYINMGFLGARVGTASTGTPVTSNSNPVTAAELANLSTDWPGWSSAFAGRKIFAFSIVSQSGCNLKLSDVDQIAINVVIGPLNAETATLNESNYPFLMRSSGSGRIINGSGTPNYEDMYNKNMVTWLDRADQSGETIHAPGQLVAAPSYNMLIPVQSWILTPVGADSNGTPYLMPAYVGDISDGYAYNSTISSTRVQDIGIRGVFRTSAIFRRSGGDGKMSFLGRDDFAAQLSYSSLTGTKVTGLSNNPSQVINDSDWAVRTSFTLFKGVYIHRASVHQKSTNKMYTYEFSTSKNGESHQQCGHFPSEGNYELPDIFSIEGTTNFFTTNNDTVSGIVSSYMNSIIPLNEMGDYNPKNTPRGILYRSSRDEKLYLLNLDKECEIVGFIDNRYILINSDSLYNAYDTVLDKWRNWTCGYNGNLIQKVLLPLYSIANNVTDYGVQLEYGLFIVAAACNNGYRSDNPFISTTYAAVRYEGLPPDVMQPKFIGSELVQYYYSQTGSDSGVPSIKYQVSFKRISASQVMSLYENGVTGYYNSDDLLIAPSLFSKFIQSYNNRAFISFNNNGVEYPLFFSNQKQILGFSALSFIEDAKAVFIIQGMMFFVTDKYIISAVLSGNTLGQLNIVTDITGMVYLGCTPKQAIFWSLLNKKIYSFTGDIILNELMDASKIEQIYKTFYLPNCNTIVISCKDSGGNCVYLISEDDFIRFDCRPLLNCFYTDTPDYKFIAEPFDTHEEAENLNFLTDMLILKYTKDPDNDIVPIEVETAYYGMGQEQIAIVDCWLIRLFSNDKTSGKITFTEKVLTDKGVKSITKIVDVNKAQYDKLTNTYFIRYQPQFQAGVGISLSVKSDIPIYSIVAEYLPDTTQISHANI